MNIQLAIIEGTNILQGKHIQSAQLDTEILMAKALGKDRKYIILNNNEDIQGKRYLDGMSGLWCVNSGYGRKELAEAAYKQLQTLSYFPMSQSHEPAIKLAEKLN